MIDWTEQYRPKQLSEIIGNRKSIRNLQQWADSWQRGKPSKKAVIFSGNPGIGKTSCAYALALQYLWTPIELNASDARNSSRIKAVATAGAIHQTFNDDGTYATVHKGGRKVIILDEADNLYESKVETNNSKKDYSDVGGKKTIIDTIHIAEQPIIIIVNDYYSLIKGSGDALKSLCLHLRFFPPYPTEIFQLLQRICHQEHILVDPEVLEAFSQTYKGDIRAAIRDLQSITIGKTHVTLQDYMMLGTRDHKQLVFDILRDIFKTTDIKKIRSVLRHFDDDPNMLLHWIAENVPYSYIHPADTATAYNALSYSDIWLGRINKRKNYTFWSYAYDEMSMGVALAKSHHVKQAEYTFPFWLKNIKKRKVSTINEKILIEKLSRKFHCSTAKTYSHYVPVLEKILPNQPDFVIALAKDLSLTKEELSYFGVSLLMHEKDSEPKEETDKINKTKDRSSKEKSESLEEQKQQSLSIDF